MLLLSELTLYYFDIIYSLDRNSAASASSKSEGIVKDWAKKVASKAKPSALLSAHVGV